MEIMLENKTIVLGVCSSIAAYKAADLCSRLKKQRANVHVIMTRNALNFINPITFETLTGNKCMVDTFDRNFKFDVEHVEIAKAADLFLIAPASANTIAKIANGLADDMLTTTFLASTCPKLIFPAMNTRMYENPITQDNLARARHYGMKVIEPADGLLACGDVGKGKMLSPEEIMEYVLSEVAFEHNLLGKKICISAGPTREAIDPVRFITNHSTGKMGYAIARAAQRRGAEVTLVSGPVDQKTPLGVNRIDVNSALEMYEAVTKLQDQMDAIVMTAAVADMRPVSCAAEKIHKVTMPDAISLTGNPDILSYLGEHKKPGQVLVGFSMETENLLENSRGKLSRKKSDMIVANSLRTQGAGFGTDTNVITLITEEEALQLPIMSKDAAAGHILDRICNLLK